jgi:hypothetical protein
MLRPTLLVAALAVACPAHADADLDALRAEIAQMKHDYQTRIDTLETRLQQAEVKADYATETATQAAQTAAATAPVESAPTVSNSFNPELSLILQGGYAHLPDRLQRVNGFLTNGAPPSPTRGFSLNDTELTLASNIDPDFRGSTNLVINDGTISVEEAWFQTLTLGNGFTLKGGRFRSGIGYQNEQHPHAWDFADNNLMIRTLFGEGYTNDGLQVKWVAPTELFTELGAEIGRGASFPGTDRNQNGIGSYALYGHVGGDVGDSSSWRSGVSYLSARAAQRDGTLGDFNGVNVDTKFSGDSKTYLADFVWKWSPHGNPEIHNFKFASELFRRDEDGSLNCTGGQLCNGVTDSYRTTQYGGYAQAVYQFMPYWRAGYRYDLLDPGSVDYGVNDAALPRDGYRPKRHSLMVDYSPSEFTRLRLQYSKDQSLPNQNDNQWFVQYIYSLGTHGAHSF